MVCYFVFFFRQHFTSSNRFPGLDQKIFFSCTSGSQSRNVNTCQSADLPWLTGGKWKNYSQVNLFIYLVFIVSMENKLKSIKKSRNQFEIRKKNREFLSCTKKKMSNLTNFISILFDHQLLSHLSRFIVASFLWLLFTPNLMCGHSNIFRVRFNIPMSVCVFFYWTKRCVEHMNS